MESVDCHKLASDILKLQAKLTKKWHISESNDSTDTLLKLVCQQHRRNFDLWHEEDKARSPIADDSVIAEVKRAIDKHNQKRNDLIETINDFLMEQLLESSIKPNPALPFNSETPGSIIDRMSIMSLKIFHMAEQEERTDADDAHIESCKNKRKILEEQTGDLCTALGDLLNDLWEERKQLKLYRQFKMYNDPSLNPEIYKAGK